MPTPPVSKSLTRSATCSNASSRDGPKPTNCLRYCPGTGSRPAGSKWPRRHDRQSRPRRAPARQAASGAAASRSRDIRACRNTSGEQLRDQNAVDLFDHLGQLRRGRGRDRLPPRLRAKTPICSLRLDHPSALRPTLAAGSRHRRLPKAPRQTLAAPALIATYCRPARQKRRQEKSAMASPRRLP